MGRPRSQMNPTITVAICTWNRAAVLRRTLNQLLQLQVPTGVNWELLVVNNNCTDNTDEVCEELSGLLPLRVLHERQTGHARAARLAIQESRGRFIAWTDDDVLVDPGWLEAIL